MRRKTADSEKKIKKTVIRKPVKRSVRKVKPKSPWHFFLKKKVKISHLLRWVLPMFLMVVFGYVSFMLVATKTLNYPVHLSSIKLLQLFDQAKKYGFDEKISFWSEQLKNDPLLLSILGEGPQIDDTAPLFTHKYDCTTFVETVAALAKSQTGVELADHLVAIRYKEGKISFETRNHFPEADWIPNNEEAGELKDITQSVARNARVLPILAQKVIYKKGWFKNHYRDRMIARVASELFEEDSDIAKKYPLMEIRDQKVRLAYIPLQDSQQVLPHIPSGAVINIVRENVKSKPVLITHQGFLIKKNGTMYFRHASQGHQIQDVEFLTYISSLKSNQWKVLGYNINQFLN